MTRNTSEVRELIHTAHLSTKRKPGAVFLVSKMYAGRAASAIACRKVWNFNLYTAHETKV